MGLPPATHLPHPDPIGPHPFPRIANTGVAGFGVRLRVMPTRTIEPTWFDVLIRGHQTSCQHAADKTVKSRQKPC